MKETIRMKESENSEATIALEKLSIGYATRHGRKVVAQDICAHLQRGELTCLIGANGVGKSTLLRTLSAFQPPLSGEIRLLDKPLGEYSPKDLAKLLAMVLTHKTTTDNLTVKELVGMGRSPYTGFFGTLTKEDEQVVEESLRSVGILALQHRKLHTLSDGEYQKTMIAKALAQHTPLILLDEPTAFLDYPSKVETLQMLRRLAHELHKSIFLSTHDIQLAIQLADKLWVMEDIDTEDRRGQGGDGGSRLVVGTPRQLAADGTLSRFIEREGIHFDSSSLTIRIDTQ